MTKMAPYRHITVTILLFITSFRSQGSDLLPRFSVDVFQDTLPAKKTEKPATPESKKESPVEPIIKEVPKARKQVKPVAIPPVVIPVKPPVIIKPKIIIKRPGIHI